MYNCGFFPFNTFCLVHSKAFLAFKLKKRDNNVIILQILPCGLGSPGLRGKACQASTVLAVFSTAEGTGLGNIDSGRIRSSGLGSEGLEKILDGGGGKVLVVVVVNLDHGGVDAGTEAFDLEDGEETVGGGLALLNAELLLNGLDDNIRATASKLAGGRSANLDKVLAHGSSVVHGVERSDLVHSHGRHLKKTSDLVHDANAGEAVLALAKVEQRHDGSLLVLGRVSLEDLGNDGLVLFVELEGDVGVVVLGVSMHHESVALSAGCEGEGGARLRAGNPARRPDDGADERSELARHCVIILWLF
jgi:hypothetical protein